jgi:hypothetical protein
MYVKKYLANNLITARYFIDTKEAQKLASFDSPISF